MSDYWLGIYTKPQAEGRAELGIKAARIPVFCPWVRTRVVQRDGDRYVIIRPLFERYVFAQCDAGRIDRLLEIDGVETVLRCGRGKVSRIPAILIDAFQRAEGCGVFDRADAVFHEGDTVRIIGGPYAGLIAKVRSAKVKKRVSLLIDFVHKMTISVDSLEMVNA
jgi:transcriptional antiterminator RfaH